MAQVNARDEGGETTVRPDVVLQDLPLGYQVASSVLAGVYEKRGTVKNLIYNHNRLRGSRFAKVRRFAYALVFEALKHQKIIDRLFERTNLLELTNLDRSVATILTYDLIFSGKSLKVHDDCQPAQLIKKHQQVLLEALKTLRTDPESEKLFSSLGERKTLPRYARVNTLVSTTDNVVRHLTKNGYHQVTWEAGTPFSKFLELVQSLSKNQFMVDYHFSDLLVFHPVHTLYKLKIHNNGSIILQDKTSMFPVRMLNPPPNSIVFDACAAPGIKTTHLSALMKNTGTIYATDQSRQRIKILDKTLRHASVANCLFHCCNFSFIDPKDESLSKAEYILLDPTCSGSGMVSRMDDLTDDAESKTKERLLKLQSFQVALLKRALEFPGVKRVVYSTCSVSVEENEEVVAQALKYFPGQYAVVNSFPEWPCRGSDEYDFGVNCVRANSMEHLTNGFFVAVLERCILPTEDTNKHDEKGASSAVEPESSHNSKKMLKKSNVKNRKNVGIANIGMKDDGISRSGKRERELFKKIKKFKQDLLSSDTLGTRYHGDNDARSRKKGKKPSPKKVTEGSLNEGTGGDFSIVCKHETLKIETTPDLLSSNKSKKEKRQLSNPEYDAVQVSNEGIPVKKSKHTGKEGSDLSVNEATSNLQLSIKHKKKRQHSGQKM